MTLFLSNDDIFIRRGDSGNIIISGLPTDKNYGVYLSVVNDNEKIIKEWTVNSYNNEQVTFTFLPSDTDDIAEGDYNYGIKICNGNMEDTLIPRTTIDNGKIKHYTPLFTVGAKFVEGVQ